MSFFRLLRQSIIFATRSRRLLVFIFIFAVLTGVTIFSLDSIFQENNSALLTTKAIIIQNTSFSESINFTTANNVALNINKEGIADSIILRYVQVGPAYIFSLNTNPWVNPEVQPSDIRTGSYLTQWSISGDGGIQALASAGSQTVLGSGGLSAGGNYSVNQDITVGNKLYIENNNHPTVGEIKYIQIVGMFNKIETFSDPLSNRLWLYVSDNGVFDQLVNEIFGNENSVRVYQMVFVAKGSTEQIQSFFFGDATTNLAQLLTNINNNLPTGWASANRFTSINSIKADATNKDLFLIFGGIGSTIVATLYAFIISRFRTREIATLKAVGYTARQVRVVLIAEIATVSIVGFILSVFAIQILLTLNSFYALNTTYVPNIWIFWNIASPLSFSWLPSLTVILAFIIVVLSNILGFLIISQKTISVRPIELFRADA